MLLFRVGIELSFYTKHIFICTNQKDPGKRCCAISGGQPFFEYMKEQLKSADLHGPGKIRLSRSGCLGRCSVGPAIVIYPEGIWFTYETKTDIDEIITEYLIHGRQVKRLLLSTIV